MPKYKITQPRYIDGVYYAASVEHPAIVEIREGVKIDRGLIPLEQPIEKPKPHYAQKGGGPTAVDAFKSKESVEAPKAKDQAKGGKRSSDEEPI